jgi:hypothetical protein
VSVPIAGCGDGEPGAAAESTEGATADGGSTSGAVSDAGSTETAGDGDGAEGGDGDGAMACNGYAELCARPYDQVIFPGTHNSNSSTSYGYSAFNANHDSGLTEQLEDGVRVMLIDVTYDGGETTMCHGPCGLGSTPHLDGLAELSAFMLANPNEVLTIIYQDSISVEDMEADWVTSGLIDLVYAHVDGEPWPTLGEMIDAGTRIVVTAESGGPPPDWYHHVWDVGWDTPYSYMAISEFSCALNRGSTDNDLYLMNHWVNSALDLPSRDNAMEANAFDVLFDRGTQCTTEAGRVPNFVAVDFYEQGDLFAAVAALNGL